MLADKDPRERIAIFGLATMAFAFLTYFGSTLAERPAPIEVTQAKPTAAPSESPAAVEEVVVHVAGRVAKPGVYRLSRNARIDDALKAAGGPAPDADLDRWNLAARVIDGTQIYISGKSAPVPSPARGRTAQAPPSRLQGTIPPMAVAVPESYRGGAAAGAPYGERKPGAKSSKSKEPAGPVNLNTATAEQLDRLPGVGPSTAAKILEYRQEHGGFGSVDELLAVKGIGPKKLEAMRKWLKL